MISDDNTPLIYPGIIISLLLDAKKKSHQTQVNTLSPQEVLTLSFVSIPHLEALSVNPLTLKTYASKFKKCQHNAPLFWKKKEKSLSKLLQEHFKKPNVNLYKYTQKFIINNLDETKLVTLFKRLIYLVSKDTEAKEHLLKPYENENKIHIIIEDFFIDIIYFLINNRINNSDGKDIYLEIFNENGEYISEELDSELTLSSLNIKYIDNNKPSSVDSLDSKDLSIESKGNTPINNQLKLCNDILLPQHFKPIFDLDFCNVLFVEQIFKDSIDTFSFDAESKYTDNEFNSNFAIFYSDIKNISINTTTVKNPLDCNRVVTQLKVITSINQQLELFNNAFIHHHSDSIFNLELGNELFSEQIFKDSIDTSSFEAESKYTNNEFKSDFTIFYSGITSISINGTTVKNLLTCSRVVTQLKVITSINQQLELFSNAFIHRHSNLIFNWGLCNELFSEAIIKKAEYKVFINKSNFYCTDTPYGIIQSNNGSESFVKMKNIIMHYPTLLISNDFKEDNILLVCNIADVTILKHKIKIALNPLFKCLLNSKEEYKNLLEINEDDSKSISWNVIKINIIEELIAIFPKFEDKVRDLYLETFFIDFRKLDSEYKDLEITVLLDNIKHFIYYIEKEDYYYITNEWLDFDLLTYIDVLPNNINSISKKIKDKRVLSFLRMLRSCIDDINYMFPIEITATGPINKEAEYIYHYFPHKDKNWRDRMFILISKINAISLCLENSNID